MLFRSCSADTILDSSEHSWIGWCNESISSKIIEDYYSEAKLISRVNSKLSRLEAVKAGVGIAQLPCFLGDDEADLHRLPPYLAEKDSEIWILTHPDLRQTTRVMTFVRFIIEELNKNIPLLNGDCYLGSGKNHYS